MAALCVVNLAGEVVYCFLLSNSSHSTTMIMARMKGFLFFCLQKIENFLVYVYVFLNIYDVTVVVKTPVVTDWNYLTSIYEGFLTIFFSVKEIHVGETVLFIEAKA